MLALVSVNAPSCVGSEAGSASSAIHPHHLLNWLRTSARLGAADLPLLVYLWTFAPAPSAWVFVCVSQCLSSLPVRLDVKSVCGPRDMTRTVLLKVLLLICSQHSRGGLGPAEEELGRWGRGSHEVLLQGNLFCPPHEHQHLSPDWCLLQVIIMSCEGCAAAMFDSWRPFNANADFAFESQ